MAAKDTYVKFSSSWCGIRTWHTECAQVANHHFSNKSTPDNQSVPSWRKPLTLVREYGLTVSARRIPWNWRKSTRPPSLPEILRKLLRHLWNNFVKVTEKFFWNCRKISDFSVETLQQCRSGIWSCVPNQIREREPNAYWSNDPYKQNWEK